MFLVDGVHVLPDKFTVILEFFILERQSWKDTLHAERLTSFAKVLELWFLLRASDTGSQLSYIGSLFWSVGRSHKFPVLALIIVIWCETLQGFRKLYEEVR